MFRQRIEEFQTVFDTIPPLLQGKCWGQDGIHYSEVFLFTNTSNGRQLTTGCPERKTKCHYATNKMADCCDHYRIYSHLGRRIATWQKGSCRQDWECAYDGSWQAAAS